MTKNKGKFRVLLMCKECDKVYNGTMLDTYERAIVVYHKTMLNNKDVCKNKDCGEPLLPIIDELK